MRSFTLAFLLLLTFASAGMCGDNRPYWQFGGGNYSVGMYRGPKGDVVPAWSLSGNMRQNGYRYAGQQRGGPLPPQVGQYRFPEPPPWWTAQQRRDFYNGRH